jgi:transcriptional regulator with XRE-family HTH domain
MFYDIFKELCHNHGETPNAVCLKLGFSAAAAPYWKKSGKAPKRDGLEKIADYFDVSVEYLLGRDPNFSFSFHTADIDDISLSDRIDSVMDNVDWNVIISKLNYKNKAKLVDYVDLLLTSQAVETQQGRS